MSMFQDKVVYQIYIKSFYDSNNDGIGDINGITQKLDYLSYLGVDYIWLTPFFVSPQNDNGYDVKDYYNVDPKFGTMDDLENLIKEAEKRNIYLMFDMVFNHTSTEHEWFNKAVKGDEFYKKFYFFKKSKDKEPTNWESKFGGSAWEYVNELDEYYLHLFDKTQADLNWDNPYVIEELIKILTFWLKKGVRGFRFDVINLISKDAFKNDESGVGKKYYTDGKKVVKYLHYLNKMTFGKTEGVITVGEMSSTTIENCIKYTKHDNKILDMTFNFHHLKVDYENNEKWTVKKFDFDKLKKLFDDWQIGMQKGGGYNALFWNCHDQPRSVSRFGDDKEYLKESAKMLATVIHLQRGTPYIYQGEEIGMTNCYFDDISHYKDVETLNAYKILKSEGMEEDKVIKILQSKSRDNARTPIQWNNKGGFSKADPWIEMNKNYVNINVEDNIIDDDSILNYYRRLIKLRKKYKVISHGDYLKMEVDNRNIYAFKRKYMNEEIIVISNFYSGYESVSIDINKKYDVLISNYHEVKIGNQIELRPYETIVLYLF